MITWARSTLLILIGASVGAAVWHSSNLRAIEAERHRLGAIDDYRTALARFVNGDSILMQIDVMKNDYKRLGDLLPSDFVDARPWIHEEARRSGVVIGEYMEGAEQKEDFYAQRGIELYGTGDYLAIARFVQSLEESRVNECELPVCEFPLHLLRQASIELTPSGDTLAFRFNLIGYGNLENKDASTRTQANPLVGDTSPDEEATRIISELKSRRAAPLEPLPPVNWPQPAPVRAYSRDPFRLVQD